MQANLTIRVLVLFAAVGAVALVIPTHLVVANSRSVMRDNSWGNLPLEVTLKAGQ